MARNAEVTRQWQVLRDIDAARTGITIPKLAAARGVPQRTNRRDIGALASAGFPLFDEKVNGTTMWKPRMAPVADVRAARRRIGADAAGRLRRLPASTMDPGFRCRRACGVAAAAD